MGCAILSHWGRTSGRGKVRESGEGGKMSERKWGLRKGKGGRDERFSRTGKQKRCRRGRKSGVLWKFFFSRDSVAEMPN